MKAARTTTAKTAIQKQFTQAMEELAGHIKDDHSILAALLCGSLSHDTVWSKSDIDLVLVTVDDKKVDCSHIALYANGVNVHAFLMPRAQFRKTVEGELRNSFMHSLLAKGRLLYTHDDTIARLCAQLQEIGERDTQLRLLECATQALGPIDKARKWLVTRGDLEYTALWILHAANALARIEVLEARLIVDREALPQAMKLNPAFFKTIYTDLLNARKTRQNVQAALDAIDDYVASRAPSLFALVLDHLREAGEARSATEIEAHFSRNFGLEGVITACEYLADQGWIGKASIGAQLTRRSNVSVQELAFVWLGNGNA